MADPQSPAVNPRILIRIKMLGENCLNISLPCRRYLFFSVRKPYFLMRHFDIFYSRCFPDCSDQNILSWVTCVSARATARQIYDAVYLQSTKKLDYCYDNLSTKGKNISLTIWNKFCYNMILVYHHVVTVYKEDFWKSTILL